MGFDVKDGAETEGLPHIELGGRRFFVPRATLRQTIGLAAMMPKVNATLKKFPTEIGSEPPAFEETDFDPLIEVIRRALSPLYPSLTKEDLLDSPIDIADLISAIPVISKQASSSRSAAAGEAQAASISTAPAGESSSPS